MAKRKSTQRRGRFVSLGVSWNPETNELRARAFIDVRDGFVPNPIIKMLRAAEHPPRRGTPVLTIIKGGRSP
jgi:hypothetical protein